MQASIVKRTGHLHHTALHGCGRPQQKIVRCVLPPEWRHAMKKSFLHLLPLSEGIQSGDWGSTTPATLSKPASQQRR